MHDPKIFVRPGWKINPNEKIVNGIMKMLERNGGYCPCDNPDKGTEFAVCPCRSYMEHDKCCCSLYIKDDGTKDYETY